MAKITLTEVVTAVSAISDDIHLLNDRINDLLTRVQRLEKALAKKENVT